VIAVDTSALCAVVLGEPEAETFLAAMEQHAGRLTVGAPTVLETEMVVSARQGPDAARDLHLLLDGVRADIQPFADHHARSALQAWLRFGKGRHPAALNLGDCMSYAVAEGLQCPLLFEGEDFSLTDCRRVL